MYTLIRLIFVNIIALKVYGEIVSPCQLLPGDTINLETMNWTSTEILGTLFSKFDGGKELTSTLDLSDSARIIVRRKICLTYNELKASLYPIIKSDGITLNLEEMFGHSDGINLKNFDDDDDEEYFNENKYRFGITHVCRTFRSKELIISLINPSYLPIVNGNFFYKIQSLPFGILRFAKKNETHYVSSIKTGYCVFQIFMSRKDVCDGSRRSDVDIMRMVNFFYEPLFKSHILTVDSNNAIVVDPTFLHDTDYPTVKYSLNNLPYDFSYYIDNYVVQNSVIELTLNSLPKLPEMLDLQKLKQPINEELHLKPGDIIDQFDFRRVAMSRMDNRTLNKVASTPITSFKLRNCHYDHEIFTGFVKDGITHYKFNLFNKMIRDKNYGVDPDYLTNNYKCYWMTICSQYQKSKQSELPSPIKVINLDEVLNRDEYNVFYGENVVMRISNETELYHVSQLEYGDCLFQMLIYPASTTTFDVEHYHQYPIHVGSLISASDNRELENSVLELISNFQYKINNSLLNARDNVINITLPIISMLTDNVLINVDLSHLK